jgi:hypothetical protein
MLNNVLHIRTRSTNTCSTELKPEKTCHFLLVLQTHFYQLQINLSENFKGVGEYFNLKKCKPVICLFIYTSRNY